MANDYGDPVYVEDPKDGGPVKLKTEGMWYVQKPSESCANYLINTFECEVHSFNGIKYALSREASDRATLPGGSACLVEFSLHGEDYFLLVLDDRDYIQVCQGSMDREDDGDFRVTALRELEEELGIVAGFEELVPVGFWSFISHNILLNCDLKKETQVFHLYINSDRVSHIFENEFLHGDRVTFIPSSKISKNLHETEYVVVIPRWLIETNPRPSKYSILRTKAGTMESVSLHGHNLELLRRRIGLEDSGDVDNFNVEF